MTRLKEMLKSPTKKYLNIRAQIVKGGVQRSYFLFKNGVPTHVALVVFLECWSCTAPGIKYWVSQRFGRCSNLHPESMKAADDTKHEVMNHGYSTSLVADRVIPLDSRFLIKPHPSLEALFWGVRARGCTLILSRREWRICPLEAWNYEFNKLKNSLQLWPKETESLPETNGWLKKRGCLLLVSGKVF